MHNCPGRSDKLMDKVPGRSDKRISWHAWQVIHFRKMKKKNIKTLPDKCEIKKVNAEAIRNFVNKKLRKVFCVCLKGNNSKK